MRGFLLQEKCPVSWNNVIGLFLNSLNYCNYSIRLKDEGTEADSQNTDSWCRGSIRLFVCVGCVYVCVNDAIDTSPAADISCSQNSLSSSFSQCSTEIVRFLEDSQSICSLCAPVGRQLCGGRPAIVIHCVLHSETMSIQYFVTFSVWSTELQINKNTWLQFICSLDLDTSLVKPKTLSPFHTTN